MLLEDILLRQKDNEKIAVKHGSNEISYKELHQKSMEFAQIIQSVESNSDKVGILLKNSIDYVVAYFGVVFAHKIVVPINPQSKLSEINRTIEHCDIDIVITSQEFESMLTDEQNSLKHNLQVYNMETRLFTSLFLLQPQTLSITNNLSGRVINEDDIAIMLPTSGSTNYPKRVMLSHKNLLSNIKSNVDSLKLSEDDVVLIALPMTFGYCNTAQFLTHLFLGATVIIMNSVFMPQSFYKTVHKEKVTNFTGVPTMLLMLLKYPAPKNLDLSTLRIICFGGGVMPLDKLRELMDCYPTVAFLQTYGQTEASPRLTLLTHEYAESKFGSVGLPIPNVKVRIINTNGEDVADFEHGEVIVSGDNIMKGYYKDPTETEKVLKHGWLHTGDIGYRDADGFLYLAGRKRNIIISGGINIYPEEIENIILSHPSVENALVMPEDHDLLGEVPIAKVIINANEELSENALLEHCLTHLPSTKIPKKIIFVNELRTTSNGKVKREYSRK